MNATPTRPATAATHPPTANLPAAFEVVAFALAGLVAEPLEVEEGEADADADAETEVEAGSSVAEAEVKAVVAETEIVAGPAPWFWLTVPGAEAEELTPERPSEPEPEEPAPPPATTLMLPVVGLGIGWPSAPTSCPTPHATPEVLLVGGVVEPSSAAIWDVSARLYPLSGRNGEWGSKRERRGEDGMSAAPLVYLCRLPVFAVEGRQEEKAR